AAVLPSQVRERGGRVGRHVLEPVGHFLHRARADVAADVHLCADHLGECHELVRAELIRFRYAAPVRIDLHRTLVARTDAFAPVICVREATARPAYDRYLQLAQGGDNVVAVAVGIRDVGILADPDAAVDPVPQVLGELTV